MELIDLLTRNLGITGEQARGGAGLLFKLARERLPESDFAAVAGLVPGIEDLIGQAPENGGGLSAALGGIASALGGGRAGALAELAAGFRRLDMDQGLIARFAQTVLAYLQDRGGDEITAILERTL